MANNTITISVLAQTGPASKGMDGLAAKLDKIGGRFSKAGNIAGIAGAGIAAGLVAAIKPASDLQQNVGGVQAMFGKFADSVIRDSNRAASQFGLSANEYDSFATVIGSQLKNAGVPIDQLGEKTKGLIGQASDLAATFGGSTSDAVEALSSAMKGEMDPIEKYGVSLNQSMLQAQAAAMGITTNSSSWTNAQKQQIILAAVTKQSTAAQGQFAKQSGTLAEQQQILKAKLDNTVANIGTSFIPVVSKLASAVLGLVDGPGFKGFTNFLATNPTLILSVVGGLLGLAGVLKTVGFVMQNWSAITRIASIVQAAFNLVLAANPVVLLVIAIAALVAGLIWFFTQTKTGQAIVRVAFAAIQAAIGAVVGWFTGKALPAITGTWKAITGAFSAGAAAVGAFLKAALALIIKVWSYTPLGLIVTNWGKIMAFFASIPGKVGAVFSAAINWLKAAGTRIITGLYNGITGSWSTTINWLNGIPSRAASGVGNLGGVLSGAGRKLIGGLLDGIQSRFRDVQNMLGDLTSKLPDWKGPADKDATLLTGAGKLIMGGLVKGLQAGTAKVKATLGDVTTLIGDSLQAPSAGFELADAAFTASGTLKGGNTYHVAVSTLNPTPEVGRAVVEAINDYERVNGPRA